jgi:hypothetical protein
MNRTFSSRFVFSLHKIIVINPMYFMFYGRISSFNYLTRQLLISSRVEKSGPFRTRFSVQREGFSSPVSIFRSRTIFFSRGTREKNSSRQRNGYREEKTLPKNRKNEYEKQAHFRNEGQKVLCSRVVYN